MWYSGMQQSLQRLTNIFAAASLYTQEDVGSFGDGVPMNRPGHPCECATAYVFLASEDGSYISGQTIHPNGGTVVSG